jgi:hypothetical protein
MAYDQALADRIRRVTADDADLSERRMFGGIAFLYRGHMFVGVTGSTLMARVGKQNHEEALGHAHVREMDFTGKPMRGYVYVDPPGITSDAQLMFWLRRCKETVSALPPKAPKQSAG